MKFAENVCGYLYNSNPYPIILPLKLREEIFTHSWRFVHLTNSTVYQIHEIKLFSCCLKFQQVLLLDLSFVSLMGCNHNNTFYPIFKLNQC